MGCPFGECRNSQGNPGTDKLFTGQRLDGTGLYYYGARYYDASIGRFISADTIVPNPANPQAFNRYTYALNNPLKYTDPTGHRVRVTGDNWEILVDAFRLYINVAVAYDKASAMALFDSETVYTLSWAPTHLGPTTPGSTTLGNEGDQTIWISSKLMDSSPERIAAEMAHEFHHAKEGRQSNSIYEEVGASQEEYEISVRLPGYTPTKSASRAHDIDLEAETETLEAELRDIQREWTDKKHESPQYNMYANLPLFPVKGKWAGFTNVLEMIWNLLFY
jgi:RHS repeat-associated protein